MRHTNSRLFFLLRRYLENACSRQELQELLKLIGQDPDSEVLRGMLHEQWRRARGAEGMPGAQDKLETLLRTSPRDMSNVEANGDETRGIYRSRKGGWWRFVAAAAILLFLAGGVYLFLKPVDPEPERLVEQDPQDVAPGGDRATLTLADGTEILLDSSGGGELARQGGMRIVKLEAGELAYEAGAAEELEKVQYNTLATPRGGQYRVTLPDGTKVWLNAASSLRYPAVFKGGQRQVELRGEAYFEVVSRKDMPFVVQLNGMEVEVLGTHFNVMAYEEESSLQTTVLEGSVLVSTKRQDSEIKNAAPADKKQGTRLPAGKAKNKKHLKPGQQAKVANPVQASGNAVSGIKVLSDVDVQSVIAWKEGFFRFERTSLPAVMRQLERWYDIEVVYEGRVPEQYFGGRIPRGLPLSKVISVLEQSEVRFRIRDRRLIIQE